MRSTLLFVVLSVLFLSPGHTQQKNKTDKTIVIDESANAMTIESVIKIDKTWAGHPVGFCLLTHGNRQYIAYYNADRSMVVGQRDLADESFSLHVLPRTDRETHGGTSTVLTWDSHNYLTLGIDSDGYIHMSGNMHVHPLTYFKSLKPHDISTLEQEMTMVGPNEQRSTYPKFMTSREGDLIFHYRDGSSGNGNEIYNIYSPETKKWSRLLEAPLTDGQGLMNAYQSQPKLMADGRYHVYWVWRDTPDCSTNHDPSYMTSEDLKHWTNAWGETVELPVTLEKKSVIVDPIPVKGGIINLAAKLCLDPGNRPLFAYHKYDNVGNLQFFVARLEGKKWHYKQVTKWDYRWEFSGNGSINSEVVITDFQKRPDGYYEIGYRHIKYGIGTLLLDKNLDAVGKVLKPEPFEASLLPEGTFPGLMVQTSHDIGTPEEPGVVYLLKWETLNRNRDRPRPEPWPEPSQLYLYKLKMPR